MPIPTEQEWVSTCMSLGFTPEEVPDLRALYRKVHAKPMKPTGRFVVYCNDILVRKSFPSREAAEEWAKYNYKHGPCWRIEPEMKRVQS